MIGRDFSLVGVFFLVSCCGQPEELSRVEGATLPSPNPASPITLEITNERAVYPQTAALRFRVSTRNSSPTPLWVCVEDWERHTGIITLRLFDADNRQMECKKGLHVDYSVEEEKTLAVLEPGGEVSGVLELFDGQETCSLPPGSYHLVAHYYCPFDGERRRGSQVLSVAGDPQFSAPVGFEVR